MAPAGVETAASLPYWLASFARGLVLGGAACQAVSMTFTIAHLSDPHLGPMPAFRLRDFTAKRAMGYVNWKRGRERLNDMVMLKRLVADLHNEKPDHVAMTGDVVNIGLPAEFAARRRLDAYARRPRGRQFHPRQS